MVCPLYTLIISSALASGVPEGPSGHRHNFGQVFWNLKYIFFIHKLCISDMSQDTPLPLAPIRHHILLLLRILLHKYFKVPLLSSTHDQTSDIRTELDSSVTRDDRRVCFFRHVPACHEQWHDNAKLLGTRMACIGLYNKGKMEAGSLYCPSDGINQEMTKCRIQDLLSLGQWHQ
jgi:hypothetical protein